MSISRNFRRAFLASALALAAGLGLSTAHAQAAYPANKPIRIVVPFVAGIAPDAMARIVGQNLSERLGAPVIIENRPGANGNIGTEYASRAQADGHTILLCGLTCSAAKTFYRNLRFDMSRDFEPIINLGTIPSVMVTSQSGPFKSLKDVVDHAKAHPGQLSFASVGFGGSPHLAGELLKRAANIDVVHVPYASSDPLPDVTAERVSFMFIPGTAAVAQRTRLRPLAVASAKRDATLDDVPTVAESGYPGFLMEPWNGLWAPKGTPEPVLNLLNEHLQAVLADPQVVAKLKGLGLNVAAGSRQQMRDYFAADEQRWQDVGRNNNITPQN